MAEERIVSILENVGAKDRDVQKVIKVLRLWRRGELTAEDVYFYVMGLAVESSIPLTSEDVRDVREALKLPRVFNSIFTSVSPYQIIQVSKGQIGLTTGESQSLKDRVSQLENQVTSLINENQNLKNQVSQLNSQIEELKAIINLKKSQILEKDKIISINANSEVTIEYNTPYAGYLEIEFSSLVGVYFLINSKNIAYNIRYPPPGTTSIQIVNPSPIYKATTKITITYVY